jgi:hypothetical protein
MRYLYGDLTEFPRQENSLELLERFVDMAVDVLKLDHEIDKSLASIEGDREFLTEALQDIDDFQRCVREAVEGTVAGRSDDDVVSILAQGVADNLSHYIDDGKSKVVAKMEQRIRQTQAEIERIHQQIFGFLKSFFMTSRVPVGNNSLRCELRDSKYAATSQILDVTAVSCSYVLNTSASQFFAEPKRFGDLMPGKLDFPVGTKKARFKKEPVAETLRLDEALLILVVDDEERCEFRLQKSRGEGQEGLTVRVTKGAEGGIVVRRLDAAGSEHAVPADVLTPAHLESLAAFWKALSPHVVSLYGTRADISAVSIDGKDVVPNRLTQELVQRLVRFLAPTIREIDQRSPAVEELCLKLEHENGRREEIYIQKQKLTRRFLELPETLLKIVSPLGIDPDIQSIRPAPAAETKPAQPAAETKPAQPVAETKPAQPAVASAGVKPAEPDPDPDPEPESS